MDTEQKSGIELARETIAELKEKYAPNPEMRYLMALIMADSALCDQQKREQVTRDILARKKTFEELENK